MTEGFPQENKAENIYGKVPFERATAKEKVDELSDKFSTHYSELGYVEHDPVKISSGVDPTVRFIGSHISVFKPEIMSGGIPVPGEFMVQDCIRTKNVHELFNDAYVPHWGSSFTSLGAITNYDRLNEAVVEALNFFTKSLGVKTEDIRIRTSSKDGDLVLASSAVLPNELLEVDTQNDTYYRHQIGIEGVVGRNFNIALRNSDGNGFSDVGNIIVLENAQKKLCAEVALGSSTILKQIHGLDHVNDCYPITGLDIKDEGLRRKFEDSIIVSTKLLREGLEPKATDNKDRILRSYIRAISYFRSKANISLEDLEKVILLYESRQFNDEKNNVANKIVEYLRSYESGLKSGKLTTKEDQVIASVLRE